MRFATVAIAGAMIMLCGCSSLPASTSVAGAGAAQQLADASGEEKICKNMRVMGSNMPKRVCSTQAEWDAFDKETRASVDAYDNDRKQGNTQGAFEN